MIITSKSNGKIKRASSLKQKKFRDLYGEYLVEGFKMVSEAIAMKKPIVEVFGTLSGLHRAGIDEGKIFPFEVEEVTEDVCGFICDSVSPQGVVAVLKKDSPIFDGEGISVLLDGISDPGNLGTIIRTSVATGIKNLFLVNCCDAYSPKAVRSSMSGMFSVGIFDCGLKEAMEILDGVPLIVADMDGEDIFSFVPPKKYCIVIGSEANGITEEVKSLASKIISIPMEKGIESLNAGVSFAVTAYTLKYLRR